MAAAATLTEAAGQAYENVFAKWVSGTVKTNLTSFATDLLPTFPEQTVNSHPVSNWLILIGALASSMASGNSFLFVPVTEALTAVDYIYRICLMASKLETQGLISGAQATAILNEYNADF